MQKYTLLELANTRDIGVRYYLASDVDARIAELRGALADIANSKDMTLKVARAKAKRIYESTSN